MQKENHKAMLEIIISIAVYFGAVALLLKGAFTYCKQSHDSIVTEP